VNDDSQTWERIAAEIRASGLPDAFNRGLTMTPESLAANEAAKLKIMEGKMSAHSIGPKEQALRAQRTVPPSVMNGAAVASEAKPAAETKKPEATEAPVQPVKESTMSSATAKKETVAKATPKKTAPATSSKKASQAKARTPVKSDAKTGVRPGSKLAIIVALLGRKEGCTTAEVLKATGWPAVSMPQQARAAGLKLRKKKDGKVTRYWAD